MVGVGVGDEQMVDVAEISSLIAEASGRSEPAVDQDIAVDAEVVVIVGLGEEAADTQELEFHFSGHRLGVKVPEVGILDSIWIDPPCVFLGLVASTAGRRKEATDRVDEQDTAQTYQDRAKQHQSSK